MNFDVVSAALWAFPLLLAVVCHEVAHGYVAYRLGDPTAAAMGRLTLNPIPHIDPIGTILLPGILLLTMNAADQPPSRGIGLPPEQFAAAFPFHLATDESLALVQVGATLGRLCPDVRPDARLDDVFRPVRPEGSITVDWVRAHEDRFVLLEYRGSGLQLRGQFVDLPGEKRLLFLGSPWFTDAAEIAARGLRFDDFAVHDPVVDLLQVFQASKMALVDAKKLAAKLSVQREELRAANERLRLQEREARRLALIAARSRRRATRR